MSEYQDTIAIRSAPADVFRFLSSVSNIPSYAPVIREARLEAGDHLVALAEPAKQQREINGYFRVSHETRSIEWGTDGTPNYHGRLEVRDSGGGETELSVELSIERQDEQRVRQTLRQALESIKRQLEQGGGYVAGGGI
ncbi:MAG TPA: SRPBCC family protein [Bryobacteraceae bacterium]|nr:SRPBCC family protein [Bryobacteraceae bacterium]